MAFLTIDGRRVEATSGATVLDAALAAGIEIPHLCAHAGIEPYGACRLCTVEVAQDGRTRLQASCALPVAEGMVVHTDTPRVKKGRAMIFEFLLARCPEVKALRTLAARWGVTSTRFESAEPDDCLLCGLCVRGCAEVVGAEAIGFRGRGVSRLVETPFGVHPETCIGCGLCTYLCPSGRMQMEGRTVAALRREVGSERPCRYMLMNLVSVKSCPENSECWRCPYDQLMESAAQTHPALWVRPAQQMSKTRMGPFELPLDRGYGRNHTWLRLLGGAALIGVDQFVAALAGEWDEVDASDRGIRLSGKRGCLNLSLPCPGRILKINPNLKIIPELLRYSPYQRGWVAIMEMPETGGNGLLRGEEAVCWLADEVERLERETDARGLDVAGVDAAVPWVVLERFLEAAPAARASGDSLVSREQVRDRCGAPTVAEKT